MRARYRAAAVADIAAIYLYLEQRSAGAAAGVIRSIYEAIAGVAVAPNAAERTDDPSVRLKIVTKFRYKIFYSIIDEKTVEILHVRHTSRRPWGAKR